MWDERKRSKKKKKTKNENRGFDCWATKRKCLELARKSVYKENTFGQKNF